MACFITPLVVGVLIKLINRFWRSSYRYRLDLLDTMLITGSILLAVEHAWHGEIVPYPPFLTAMGSSGNILTLLREIVVVGGSMTFSVTTIWYLITNNYVFRQKLLKLLEIRTR